MEELESCELGKHQFWENKYKNEIQNFVNHGDPGEIWYGEDTIDRIIRWLNRKKLGKHTSILDVGCGNGMLLVELFNEGYLNLHGVDYSKNAIELAKGIAIKYEIDVKYSTCDILEGLSDSYDIIIDKGTYDAISLSVNSKESREKYVESIHNSLNTDSIFVIASCNWTESELNEYFKDRFNMVDVIPTPTFKFGGTEGTVVSVCVFKKNTF